MSLVLAALLTKAPPPPGDSAGIAVQAAAVRCPTDTWLQHAS